MKWFHRHGPWEPIDAYCDRQTHYAPGGPQGLHGHYAVTHVVMRCKQCGELKVKNLPGWFTLERLKAEPDEVSKVLRELESK